MQFSGSIFGALEMPSVTKSKPQYKGKSSYVKGKPKSKYIKSVQSVHDSIPIMVARGDINSIKSIASFDADSIMYAQHPETLDLLLRKDVDPRYADSIALIIAAKMGSLDSCKKLLEAGAEPSDQSYRCILVAAEMGFDEVLVLLLSHVDTRLMDVESLQKANELANKYKHKRCVSILSNTLQTAS